MHNAGQYARFRKQQRRGLLMQIEPKMTLTGANVNILASDGPDSVEKLSGMSHLSGIAVTVQSAAGPVNRQSWSGH